MNSFLSNFLSTIKQSNKQMSNQLKVVRATYYAPSSIFKIPKTIDLEDKTVVKGYWVKYDTLYIEFVDTTREVLEIQPYLPASEAQDYKHPQELEIVDAEDEGIEDDEEEPYDILLTPLRNATKQAETEELLAKLNQAYNATKVAILEATSKM